MWLSAPCPGAKYIYISVLFKHRLLLITWLIKAKFNIEQSYEMRTKMYINDLGHVTMMAVMAIYSKNLLIKIKTEIL